MKEFEAAFTEGRAFFTNEYATLTGGASRKYMITTPNDKVVANLCVSVHATADVSVTISEGADRTGGTGLTEYNRDRNSALTSSMTVVHSPTSGATDGTTIMKWATPSGGNVADTHDGWEAGRSIQLKRGTKYCVLVTDVAGGCNISTTLSWTEEARFMITTTTTTSTTTSTTSSTTTAP